MYRYFVTTEQATSGTHPLKNVTFDSACNGGEQGRMSNRYTHLLVPTANAGAVFYVRWFSVIRDLRVHVCSQVSDTPSDDTQVNGATVW